MLVRGNYAFGGGNMADIEVLLVVVLLVDIAGQSTDQCAKSCC